MDRQTDLSNIGSKTRSQKGNQMSRQEVPDRDSYGVNGVEEPSPSQPTDLEALSHIPTGRPIHSVFTKRQKQFIVFMASWGGFFSPLTANIYFPALNALSADLQVSSTLINLTLTSYMIFQGLAPSFMGDLADVAGRRPVYVIGFAIYIAANIGLALQHSYAVLFVLRCVQSSGSSAMIALAYGVVADVASSSERGTYLGLANLGAMIGPCIGPVLGGILSQFLGWKSIFWFLTILAAVYIIIFIITFPETGRSIVGNGSVPPAKWNMSLLNYWQARKMRAEDSLHRTTSRDSGRRARAELASQRKVGWPDPLKTLKIVVEKDAGMLLFYNSLVYTAFYCVISSVPSLFAEIYSFNELQIGLSFIPFGVGCCVASILNGRLLDFNYRRVAAQAGIRIDKKRGEDMRHFPIERARLQVVIPFLYSGALVLLCWGWILEKSAPLAVSLIFLFLLGVLLNGSFNAMSTMLVDLFPERPATATAANNLVRCLMGAAGTAVILQMVEGMGRGWCFTFIAGVVLVASPMIWALLRWGPGWREERRVRKENQDIVGKDAEKGGTTGQESVEKGIQGGPREEKGVESVDTDGDGDGNKDEGKEKEKDISI